MIIGEIFVSQQSTPVIEKRRIYGYSIIKATSSPTRKRILVYGRGSDGVELGYLASTISDASTGFWEIKGLPVMPDNTLVVTAFDDSKTFNAEIYDFQSLVV